MVAEKIGKVLALIGPIAEENGAYRAHVLVNLLIPLKSSAKITIIDGNDRETINVRIFFDKLPFATCKRCWTIDHRRDECEANLRYGRRNIPRITIQNEETINIIMNRRWVQSSRIISSVQSAVAGLRIYDSEIDRERNHGRKRMRMEIDEEIHGRAAIEIPSSPQEATTGASNNSETHIGVQNIQHAEFSKAISTSNASNTTDLISLEELRKAIKGKGKITEEIGDGKDGEGKGKTSNTNEAGSVKGDTKVEKQKKKFSDWARMLGQYVSLGKERNQISIGKERKKSMLSSWVKIDENGNEDCENSIPIEVAEKVLNEDEIVPQVTNKVLLDEQAMIEFATSTNMTEEELNSFAGRVGNMTRNNSRPPSTTSGYGTEL